MANGVGGGGVGAVAARAGVRERPPAVYNRDVIPSPRHSPMKSRALINVRLNNLTGATAAAAVQDAA